MGFFPVAYIEEGDTGDKSTKLWQGGVCSLPDDGGDSDTPVDSATDPEVEGLSSMKSFFEEVLFLEGIASGHEH